MTGKRGNVNRLRGGSSTGILRKDLKKQGLILLRNQITGRISMENLMPYRIKWELSKWLMQSLKLEAQEIDRFETQSRKTKENR